MSELQNEAVEPELNLSDEPAIEETPGESADLATASEAEHETQPQVVDEEAKKQEAIQKAINKKHFEAKEAERKLAEAQAKIDEFEAKQRQEMEARVGNIPPLPDPFDDDYEAKLKAREDALLQKAQFDAQQAIIQQQQQAQIQQAQAAKEAQVRESMTNYSKRAVELGIEQNELQAAGNTVAQYGLSDDLVLHILGDADGPLITKHLAANPQEGFELAQMSPYQVGSYLDGIKQKAGDLKPKSTNAPKPSQQLEGGSKIPDDGYQHIKGAKFE